MPRKPRQTALDPLATLTSKPAPISKAETVAAQHAEQALVRRSRYLCVQAYRADPTRDRTGPQIRLHRDGKRRYVAHGNPNDLLGRW